jgi:hypothetical protein
MMIMVINHEEINMEQSDQDKGIIIEFRFCRSKMCREVIDRV